MPPRYHFLHFAPFFTAVLKSVCRSLLAFEKVQSSRILPGIRVFRASKGVSHGFAAQ